MPTNNSTQPTTNKAADAARTATDEAARTVRTATNAAASAGQQAAGNGADIARAGADTARDAFQSGLNSTMESFQRVTDQFTQVLGFAGPQSEELSRRSSENLGAVSQASTVLAKGIQEISQTWLGLAQERLQRNVESLNRLAGCRSVQDIVAIQSEFVRDSLQQTIDASRRMAELSARVATEAAGPIQTQAGRNAVELDRSVDRARRTA
jgi:phasin family protein